MKNKPPKIIPIKKPTNKDIHDWIVWAEKEIKEYQKFIKFLKSKIQ